MRECAPRFTRISMSNTGTAIVWCTSNVRKFNSAEIHCPGIQECITGSNIRPACMYNVYSVFSVIYAENFPR